MTGMGAANLHVGVLTAPDDPVGRMSPLVGMRAERLAEALQRRGCRIVAEELRPEVGGAAAYRAAAETGRALAHRWRAAGILPTVLLCDSFLTALAAFAVAGRTGARVVLWLGTAVLPEEPDVRRLVSAVARSAAAVLAASGELALQLRAARLSDRIDVIPPAVDLAGFAEPPPWRLRQNDWADPAGHRMVVAVPGPPGPAPEQRQIIDLVERAVPSARAVTTAGADVAGSLAGIDVAITGLLPDGGRTTLHSMARGAAVISMPRLPDRDLVVHRSSGMQVEDSRALHRALVELDRDVFLREALAQGAVDKVRAQHATDVVAELLHDRLALLVAPTVPSADRVPGD